MMLVAPDRVPWKLIREGCAAIKAKTPTTWEFEDVFLAVMNKQAAVYLTCYGFCVLQIMNDRSGPYLFVWLVYGNSKDERHQIMHDLRQLAIKHGCRRMEMRSARRWDAADIGWRAQETTYVADIWPGDE